nr:myosin-17-like isoform X3 [Ipomoea batatas]GME08174.1 myosin-17-like isoform X3 [Ipomoea batatas]
MEQYKGAAFGELSPHVFDVADVAYRSIGALATIKCHSFPVSSRPAPKSTTLLNLGSVFDGDYTCAQCCWYGNHPIQNEEHTTALPFS